MKINERRCKLMEEKIIYKGLIFTLNQKTVKKKGKDYLRDIIRHPGGVGVLVIIDQKILLVQQMRPAIDQMTLEIPAGKLEYGEDPLKAGLRELNEEAGYTCKELQLIQSFVSTPGFCDERIWIYEAIDPIPVKQRLTMDEDEEIECQWIPIHEAYEMTRNGKIIDAKTIMAIDHAILKEKKV